MSGSRLSRVLSAFSAIDDGTSLLARVCRSAVGLLAVDGAGLSVLGDGHSGPLCIHGRFADEGETMQLTVGEGPCREAFDNGVLVEEPDMGLSGATRWPAFTEGMMSGGLGSVASFPLQMGGARFGALTLYRATSGVLTNEQAADGYVLAQVASHLVLGAQARTADDTLLSELEQGFVRLAPVHQATGMVMTQLGVDVGEAFVRLRSRAFSLGLPLLEASAQVVAGSLDFTRDD